MVYNRAALVISASKMASKMKILKYNLEIAVFVCGAVVMVFELVGSRVLGPYFGTSIFVWTSLIGIILGSLSLGYYIGGKVADRKPSLGQLSMIIFLSAVSIGLTILVKAPLLEILDQGISTIKTGSVAASLILFLPTSVLLGMVSPYAAKLKIKDLVSSGSRVGNLYALSTAGSIAGTFLSGFYLIPHFGTNRLLLILSMILLAVSLLLSPKQLIKTKMAALLILLLGLLGVNGLELAAMKDGFVDVDTAYNRIWISDQHDRGLNKKVRSLAINRAVSSAMLLDSDELVYEYTKYYRLARHFNPTLQKALMIGGAGYSYPKDFLKKYADATLDVVEIDPAVTELAKRYFNLKADPRLAIFHEDGRVFLNRATKKYDAILGDAFTSQLSLPYQLTTREAVQKKYDALNEDGVVIVNIISSIEGEKGQFLRAEYKTFKSVFPQVYLFPVASPDNGSVLQNIILIALKSTKEPTFESDDPELNGYLGHLWTQRIDDDMPILTDDFAPVDHYIRNLI